MIHFLCVLIFCFGLIFWNQDLSRYSSTNYVFPSRCYSRLPKLTKSIYFHNIVKLISKDGAWSEAIETNSLLEYPLQNLK